MERRSPAPWSSPTGWISWSWRTSTWWQDWRTSYWSRWWAAWGRRFALILSWRRSSTLLTSSPRLGRSARSCSSTTPGILRLSFLMTSGGPRLLLAALSAHPLERFRWDCEIKISLSKIKIAGNKTDFNFAATALSSSGWCPAASWPDYYKEWSCRGRRLRGREHFPEHFGHCGRCWVLDGKLGDEYVLDNFPTTIREDLDKATILPLTSWELKLYLLFIWTHLSSEIWLLLFKYQEALSCLYKYTKTFNFPHYRALWTNR